MTLSGHEVEKRIGVGLSFTFELVLLVGPALSASTPVNHLTFQECQALFARAPDSEEAAHCFYEIGWYQDRKEEARRELRALQQEHPKNLEILLNLAYLEEKPSDKEGLYLDVLEKFQARQNLNGQLRTRDSYWRFLRDQGRIDGAEHQLDLMRSSISKVDSWRDKLRIDLAWADFILENRSEFLHARDLIKPYEGRLDQLANYRLKLRAWELLGSSSLELGMPSSSFYYYRKASDLSREKGAYGEEAHNLGNALMALRDKIEESSDPEIRTHTIEFARTVLSKATDTEEGSAITRALLVLGDLHRDDEALSYYQECVDATAGRPDFVEERRACKFSLAASLARTDPDRALACLRELQDESPGIEGRLNQVYDRHSELRVLWATRDFEEAWQASLETLDLLEELRDVQPEAQGRAKSVAAWGMSYPWLAGLVLGHFEKTGSIEDLEKAFRVVERMRARLLLDELEARARPRKEPPGLQDRREKLNEALGEKTRLQRRLRFAGISNREREQIAARLDALHQKIEIMRRQISQLSGRFQDVRLPHFATISDIQENLAADEALLSFQLAPWESTVETFAGGSWLIVITREDAAAYRLPDSDKIGERVDMLAGLLEQGKSGRGLLTRLYEDLLAKGLKALPTQITKLIVIPDKALYRLPLAALQPTKDAPPLATRYRFSRIPSATLWLRRWREPGPPSVAPKPALVLADPGVADENGSPAAPTTIASINREGDLFRAESYGPLPFARQEGWSVVRQLGPGTKILTGYEASERSLNSVRLSRFGILHFAAHAVPNEEEPDRAGVVLAPDFDVPADGTIYDGLLQFNEIVDLGFAGRTVVLSTCQSARGQILRGEGVFDLARAFFEGGARAVVGSLWQLEDKATARFFDDFYRHLARGVSLSEALHLAQTDQIRRGGPPSVWAGIVVIGDGSLVPVPSHDGRHHPAWPIAIALVLLAAAVGVAARRNP